jgi:hypothetical protein
MSRFWMDGLPLQVTVAGESPSTFDWHNRTHQIVDILNHWRSDGQWWEKRVAHDYFLVRTASGLIALIFRDCLTENWYLRRLYD